MRNAFICAGRVCVEQAQPRLALQRQQRGSAACTQPTLRRRTATRTRGSAADRSQPALLARRRRARWLATPQQQGRSQLAASLGPRQSSGSSCAGRLRQAARRGTRSAANAPAVRGVAVQDCSAQPGGCSKRPPLGGVIGDARGAQRVLGHKRPQQEERCACAVEVVSRKAAPAVARCAAARTIAHAGGDGAHETRHLARCHTRGAQLGLDAEAGVRRSSHAKQGPRRNSHWWLHSAHSAHGGPGACF